jgi:Domain of unknown function (DUF4396)
MATATHPPEQHDHHDHHHELPTSGRALDAVALSATLHCLTGCAIGEVIGMVVGTALGFSEWGTVALAVGLAFLFGYSLTSLPLLRAGLAFSVVVPIALATDTFSIAVMEIVDNAIMLSVPGAMESGVGDVLFWGALSFALVIAGVVAFPVNRWLITRGRGHAVLHNSGHHPNFPTRIVALVATTAFLFGSAVLVAEAVDSDGSATHGEAMAPEPAGEGHGGAAAGDEGATEAPVPGLAVSANGVSLELDRTTLPRGRRTELSFRVLDGEGRAVRDFEVEQDERMHLIVVRRDTRGFQHLHPRMRRDGTWSTSITVREAGSYRAFADFQRDGEKVTLGSDLAVDGPVEWQPLPAASSTAAMSGGYEVRLAGGASRAGGESDLAFTVTRDGETVRTEPYLGAGGHLVALRDGDLAYLHTHPAQHGEGEGAGEDDAVPFATEFPSAGRYRLFFQFKHDGRVHTAAFTREVAR